MAAYAIFDVEIYDILDALIDLEVIETNEKLLVEQIELLNEYQNEVINENIESYDENITFKLTDYGKEKTKEIFNEIPVFIINKIKNIKVVWSKKPLIKILHYVYSKYPDYASLSEANIND